METVQLQCGHCQQVIAIGVEHLGGQVQCPHCQGVLQTPPPPSALSEAPTPDPADPIFAGPEPAEAMFAEESAPSVRKGMHAAAALDNDESAEVTRFKPR